jgi:four helix bundle protein
MKIAEISDQKTYDLEQRTFSFARNVYDYVELLPKTITNIEIGKQLTRSAGSVGANYIEANESLGKKNFNMRVKISRKEAKESRYWIALSKPVSEQATIRQKLIQEATELMNICGAIVRKMTT